MIFEINKVGKQSMTLEKALNILEKSPPYKKNVLIRVDFNVPVRESIIQDPTRIIVAQKTIEYFLKAHARIVLISHFKDPKDIDLQDPHTCKKFYFKTFQSEIEKYLGYPLIISDLYDENLEEKIKTLPQDTIILLENSRLWPGEKTCDDSLSQRLASLGCVFINEAFSCAHRKHASTTGIAQYLPTFPGFHFQKELKALKQAFQNAEHPVLAVIGGAKISSKFPILENLLPKVDFLGIGGAMVHTFFVYQGLSIGQSLYEPEYVEQAGHLLQTYREKFLFPCDVCAAKNLTEIPEIIEISQGVRGIPEPLSSYDIGPSTVLAWAPLIQQAKTIIWNGTLGVAEHPPFDEGSRKVAQLISKNQQAFSLAGGGDTLAALTNLGFSNKFSHICTGGGAFLEWLAHGSLPAEQTFMKN